MEYRCHRCEIIHTGLPDIAADKPDPWWSVPEEEREHRIELTSDTCIIDGREFFIRGVIEIPILETEEVFGFGVWVSQHRENFFKYVENFHSAGIGPFFGWLCTRMACYQQDTWLLKTRAHFRGGKLRPLIELEPTDHPLAIDQRNGMTLDRAWEMVHFHDKVR